MSGPRQTSRYVHLRRNVGAAAPQNLRSRAEPGAVAQTYRDPSRVRLQTHTRQLRRDSVL